MNADAERWVDERARILPTWSDDDIDAALPLAVMRRDKAREAGLVDEAEARAGWVDRLLDAKFQRTVRL